MKKNINGLLGAVEKSRFFNEILSKLNEPARDRAFCVKTLPGSLKSLTLAALAKKSAKILLVSANPTELADYRHDLELFFPSESIALLSVKEQTFQDKLQQIDTETSAIVDGVSTLISQNRYIALAQPEALVKNAPPPKVIERYKTKIRVGDNINYNEFVQGLSLEGFDRKDFVASSGDIAIRGGILDIFPIDKDNPIRIEFFGNEIDSIREFDPISQRSISERQEIEFIARVFSGDEEDLEHSSVFDYIDSDVVIIIDSPESVKKVVEEKRLDNFYAKLENFKTIEFNSIYDTDIELDATAQITLGLKIKDFSKELLTYVSQGFTVHLCAESDIHLNRFQDLLESELKNMDELEDSLPISPLSAFQMIKWSDVSLTKGFVLPEEKILCFTEHQIFNRRRAIDAQKKKRFRGITLKELQSLKRGDYVVHEDKGIAIYDGLKNIEVNGIKQEAARLLFAEGDKVFVNINFINKIQKYSSSDGTEPKLSKLGSAEWAKRKARAKKKLKDLARDLIKLYAQRKSEIGFPYPTDTLWQKEFESSFMYEDTADQAKATRDVKDDMESTSPMDRLVCGDVGFGKTEIAIRAAFKAVQANKQAAILAPTTILAEQHFFSFKDRLANYPVRVEALSRFRTKKEQDKIIKDLEAGRVDILIGTHRLLSKDVKFKDIGLLVIDEEHRFGVGAKEKLRHLKASVDTLTLTATPIPRTLNFSLMGARDLSVIETPPRNRLPIETEIIQWKPDVIAKVIKRELRRGGQVFFVNDRINDLPRLADKIRDEISDVRIVIAHGQMSPAEIEKAMDRFTDKKFDVLLTTKIIESGIDIPNANTILINRANNFGLAELYQLRGRVGRSNEQAYCYLIVDNMTTLSKDSLRRLQAIEEFTELGSGLKLAMRDMEIRGAGNLLGAEQSGFIIDLGLELYQKILDETVQELRNEEFFDLFDNDKNAKTKGDNFNYRDATVDIEGSAMLPKDYIESDVERFDIYKRIYTAKDENAIHELFKELQDRFGKPPAMADNLKFGGLLRLAVMNCGFIKGIVKNHKFSLECPDEKHQNFYNYVFPKVAEKIAPIKSAKLIQNKSKLMVEIPIPYDDYALRFMNELRDEIYKKDV